MLLNRFPLFSRIMALGPSKKNENVIRGYRIGRLLGSGASASVFYAEEVKTGLPVAVKILFPSEGDENALKERSIQYDNEVTLAWKVFHPFLTTIYEAFEENGHAFVVMEYAGGGSLQQYTAEQQLPLERILDYARKCCSGLGYASRCGVIHRDIKPANLLLTDHQDIRISDFGGALFVHLNKSKIEGLGSPAYMSPEQVRGDALDFRTDMFSLGVVLYRLLTHTLPFHADDVRVVYYKILYEQPVSLRKLRPDIPEYLAQAVHKALEKEAGKRYASWEEFEQALEPHEIPKKPQDVKEQVVGILKKIPLFQKLDDGEYMQLSRHCRFAKPAGGKLPAMREQEMVIPLNGELIVKSAGNDADRTIPSRGWIFGRELSAFPAARSEAVESPHLCIVDIPALYEYPDIARKVLPTVIASYQLQPAPEVAPQPIKETETPEAVTPPEAPPNPAPEEMAAPLPPAPIPKDVAPEEEVTTQPDEPLVEKLWGWREELEVAKTCVEMGEIDMGREKLLDIARCASAQYAGPARELLSKL